MDYAALFQLNAHNFAFWPHRTWKFWEPWYYPLKSENDFKLIHRTIIQELAKQTTMRWANLYGVPKDGDPDPFAQLDWGQIAGVVIGVVLGIIFPVVVPFEGAIDPIIGAILDFIINAIKTQIQNKAFGACPADASQRIQAWALQATSAT